MDHSAAVGPFHSYRTRVDAAAVEQRFFIQKVGRGQGCDGIRVPFWPAVVVSPFSGCLSHKLRKRVLP